MLHRVNKPQLPDEDPSHACSDDKRPFLDEHGEIKCVWKDNYYACMKPLSLDVIMHLLALEKGFSQ